MKFNFEGKKALVTGGGSGLGRECALLFAKNGADVLIADLKPERCEAVANEVRALGRNAIAFPIDVTDEGIEISYMLSLNANADSPIISSSNWSREFSHKRLFLSFIISPPYTSIPFSLRFFSIAMFVWLVPTTVSFLSLPSFLKYFAKPPH